MKIESINVESKVNCPKISEVNSKKIKSSIPGRWKRMGLSFGAISFLFANKTAYAIEDMPDTFWAGGLEAGPADIYIYREIILIAGLMLSISAICAIAGVLSLLITTILIRFKKVKVSKSLKVLIVLSVLVFIIGCVGLYFMLF